MANSPGSAERRAHLIREMSRQGDHGNSGASIASSDGSVHGQFQAFDTESQQLPAVRPDHEFQINTSALRRAFPDFSQYGSSEEDSIEVGRGLKKNSKSVLNKEPSSEDVTESLPFTFGNGAKYRITGTPPIKPRHANIPAANQQANNAKRDAGSTAAVGGKGNENNGKETRFGSASSRENENEERQTYDLHARVESDDSGSINDGRVGLVDTSIRNTRFSNRRAKQAARAEQALQNGTNTSFISGTHQSFVLPDMPNITELISGVRQDGTPIFTRSAKPRSRFTTPSNSRRSKLGHVPVASAPVPSDEQALYVSLQLLQKKVTALESEKAESEKKLDDYELEVLQLKSKLEQRQHARNSDSGIGTDAEDAKVQDVQDEKSQLELSIKTLQERLERTNRKVSKSEATIQNLTNDRDAAHRQLSIAFLNSEELKKESQAMREELENIREQLLQLNLEHEKKVKQLGKQEFELRAKIDRREKAINEMSLLAKELWQTRNALAATSSPLNMGRSFESQLPEQLQLRRTRKASQGNNPVKAPITQSHSEACQIRTVSKSTADAGNASRHNRVTSVPRPTYDDGDEEAAVGDSTTHIHLRRPDALDLTKNSTYLSFMEGDEVSKLRRIVEEDKARLAMSRGLHSEQSAALMGLPRKPSLKKVQYEDDSSHHNVGSFRSMRDDNIIGDTTKTSRSNIGDRQYTQQSIVSQTSERRRRSGTVGETEMTSAFILPDITLAGAALNAQIRAGQLKEDEKQTTSIPRPIPVSDRVPSLADGEPDVTLRPAQSPALALAMVLKGLEDDLAQLRTQLAKQESLYQKHDPALSKRKRKIVYARMQKLLAAIEVRADQIYALYDVLEGQKASGQMMQEDEVEVTLQTIGIDPQVLRTASEQPGKRINGVRYAGGVEEDDVSASEVDDNDESEELPWEGFEPTQTQTIDNIGRLRGR